MAKEDVEELDGEDDGDERGRCSEGGAVDVEL